jgi:GT2 family glycosyltransferase
VRCALPSRITAEFIVVDNASTDGSVEMLRTHFPKVTIMANERNIGFAAANNQAMEVAQGRYFLLFNSDAVATPDSIAALLRVATHNERAGIVGARLVFPDGSFQASYTRFPSLAREVLILTTLGRRLSGPWYPSGGPQLEPGPRRVDYVEGACLLVRRAAYEDVGGLDEGYFMYAEEVDWAYTMAVHGWQTWYAPDAEVIHFGGGSSRSRPTQREADLYRSRVRFMRKHHGAVHANALKVLLYTSTAAKLAFHSLLRLLAPERSRPVVGLNQLTSALRDV